MKDPLIVEVKTADGTIKNVLLTQGIEIRHFFEINDDISYFYDPDEVSEPKDLIGMSVYGMVEEKGDVIKEIKRVFDFYSLRDITKELKLI
jgi:cytochrome c-type biogenesis protein CcmE